MKVYFIPGLGADKRVFKHIRLSEIFEVVHLEWITPLANESLHNYAKRLMKTIDQTTPFALVGLSFGGMLVAEISKVLPAEKTILISSLPSATALPFYYRALGALKLHRIVPVGWFKNASLAKRLFTAEKKEDKALLRAIIRSTDPHFLRWAITAILSWEKSAPPKNYYHIHGTSDRLLPIRYVQATHRIKGGGHLMVLNRASEISNIIASILHH
jgi:pimeloyl-ACP methyl ester carboxylesterase